MKKTDAVKSAINHAVIAAGRMHEQNERILALLAGAMALLDRDRNCYAMALLDVAADDVGDIENLLALETALKEVGV